MKNETQGRKFAVVTGASSGIGFELAKEFANHNFDLLMVAEDEGIAECASSLSLQVDAQPLRADLRTRAGVEQVYEWIRLNSRAVDALALNAGVGLGGSFVTSDLQKELDLVQLNVSSVVHLARLLLPDMVARNQGRVLITSSMAALMPGPFFATYAASKSFLLSFSEALYNELKDSGVSVTALMPGATKSFYATEAD